MLEYCTIVYRIVLNCFNALLIICLDYTQSSYLIIKQIQYSWITFYNSFSTLKLVDYIKFLKMLIKKIISFPD